MRMRAVVLVGVMMAVEPWLAAVAVAQTGPAHTAAGPTGTMPPAARPTIHNVTLDAPAGVLTITGLSFGHDPVVTVDGQPATVLPGGSETRLEVVAPAALLTTAGSYRLTVTDLVREGGDSFVVATGGGPAAGGTEAAGTPAGGAAALPVAAPATADAGTTTSLPPAPSGPLPLTVIEDGGAPYRTAIGYHALFANTTGTFNTASGNSALANNTTGGYNTATGVNALYANSTGAWNTASGVGALEWNSTGGGNTASGYYAL